MKSRYSLLAFLLFCSHFTFSQVTEDVSFDNFVSTSDNDLVNHFYGTQSMYQVPGNGISGGSIAAPDSNNWGNDNSRYCSRYSAVDGATYTTSICFHFDPTLIGAGFDRATSIWIQPNTDPNHYIIATVSHNQDIEVYTYGSFTSTTNPMTLSSGNWYKLTLSFNSGILSYPDSIPFSVSVLDLGPSGTGPALLVGSVFNEISDSTITRDSTIEVSITGARFGGVDYLDNFHFEGYKSADSCLFSSVKSVNLENSVKIISTNENLIIKTDKRYAGRTFLITDVLGREIISSRIKREETVSDISQLKNGIYFLTIFYGNEKIQRKFSILK